MTVPVWVWVASAAGLAAVVAVELVLAGWRGRGSFTTARAARWAVGYVSLALVFGLGVRALAGWTAASQYYAGYLTEYSLSLDNLVAFYLVMNWFKVPAAQRHRVLLLGIGLALVLRSALIVAGAAALSRFDWLFFPLAMILAWTATGLLRGQGEQSPEPNPWLMAWLGRRMRPDRGAPGGRAVAARLAAGPGVLLAVAIAATDVVFAVDSIPALFGITTSAYLIVACNAFALMGLRQAYLLLAHMLDRVRYLTRGLAVICAFIAAKLMLQGLHGSGARWAPVIPAWLSLIVVGAVLTVTVLAGAAGRRATGRGSDHQDAASARGPAGPAAPADLSVLGRRFAVIDIDRNGVWQRADYDQLIRRLCDTFGHAVDSAPARAAASGQRDLFDALLRHMDANDDQEISFSEFAAAVGRPVADRPGFDAVVRTAASTLIQMADRDGNGVLDPGEYAELAAVYGASAEQAARAFSRLDLDHNGTLDGTEFSTAISQFFTSPDPDGPGNLAFGCF